MHINIDKHVIEILNNQYGYNVTWEHFIAAYRERKHERDEARRQAGLPAFQKFTTKSLEAMPENKLISLMKQLSNPTANTSF